MSPQAHHPWTKLALASAMVCCCLLAGCGPKEDPNKEAEREMAQKEGEGKATGGACRQAGRALEDCFTLNPNSQRASVFTGWRDMNDYMRENKMADVKPTIEPPKPADASAPADAAAADAPASTEEKETEAAK